MTRNIFQRVAGMCVGSLLLGLSVLAATVASDKPAPNTITIDNFSFTPATLTVEAGTAVTWINHDDIPHTVLSTDKTTLVSAPLDTDEKFTHTFATAGTNDYYCSIHPHMKGRVIVQERSHP